MRNSQRMLGISMIFAIVAAVVVGCAAPSPAPTPTKVEETKAPAVTPTTAPTATEKPKAPTITPTPGPTVGGTLVIGLGPPIVSMDGMYESNTVNQGALKNVVEKLVDIDAEGNIQPQLATSWEASADGKAWTFHLRKGVKFHDGTDFNADAVKATFERNKDPNLGLPRSGLYNVFDSIDVVDDYTVSITTQEPYGPMLALLTHASAGIQTSKYRDVKEITKPIGTGPFVFEEWKPGESFTIIRNDNYWGPRALLDKVVMKELPDDSTRIAALEAGELQFAYPIPPAEIDRLRANPNLVVDVGPALRVLYLQMNTSRKPLDDVRVRQAIKYAIDVDPIVKGVLQGLGTPADSLVAPGVVGYYAVPDYHRYDPAKARQLLAEAGYPNGFKTRVWMGAERYVLLKEILTAVQAQLKEVGIDMEIEPVEWNTLLALLRKPQEENEVVMNAWAWSSPTGDIQYIFDSNLTAAAFPPARWNFMFWDDKEFNEVVASAQTETDPARRFELIKRAQEIVADQVPQINLIVYGQATARSAKVHNVVFPPTEEFYLGSAWIAK